MKRFRYKARTQQGKLMIGIVEAVDEKQAVVLLRERGLVVIKLKIESNFKNNFSTILGRVSLSNLANFTRQMATMVNAGLTLVDALLILENQAEGGMKDAIIKVRRSVESGKSLSKALEAEGKVFDQIYISLVKSGEAGGVLDKVLNKLADNLEKKRDFLSKVRGALLYPIIIFLSMVGVMVIMLIFVIPQLSELYVEFETELPILTSMLIQISDIAVRFWWVTLVVFLVVIFAWKPANRNPILRRQIETMFLAAPVFGILWEQITMATFTRTLSLLATAGVPIVESLNLSAKVTTSKLYEKGINDSAILVEKGFSLAEAFGRQEQFPSILPQMLSVGEETGQVGELLERISVYFQTESEQRVKNLTTAIEPLILVFLGAGVGFLVFAIVMPIYNLTTTL